MSSFSHPFENLFALRGPFRGVSEASGRRAVTAGGGSFPPIDVCEKGDDFVAVVELPGIDNLLLPKAESAKRRRIAMN